MTASRRTAGPKPLTYRPALLAVPVGILAAGVVFPLLLDSSADYIERNVRNLGVDWRLWVAISRVENPFDLQAWRWSPVAAWILGSAIVPLGYQVWLAAHFIALVFLRNTLLVLAILVFASFWDDALKGNAVVFQFVAGWMALGGSRSGTVLTYALALLMPRPLVIPLVAYLGWRETWSRRWLVGLFVAHAALVVATGRASDWILRLLEVTGREIERGVFLSPAALLGPVWLPLAALSALLLWRRGRLGLAGIALSPYVIPNYWLIALLDLRRFIR